MGVPRETMPAMPTTPDADPQPTEGTPWDDTFKTQLARHIRQRWETLKRDKIATEDADMRAKRARKGEYEPDHLQEIIAMFPPGYEPIYMMIPETKCRAAENWIKDILKQAGDNPFSCEATPLPEVPAPLKEMLRMMAAETIVAQEMMATGIPPSPQAVAALMQQFEVQIEEQFKKDMHRLAKEAAAKMQVKIEDQFHEGGWFKEMDKWIYDLVTYRAAILKGPIIKKEFVRTQVYDETTGKWTMKVESRTISKWGRVDPSTFYPSADCTGPNDADLAHLERITRGNLYNCIGLEGYKEDAIREVLREHSHKGLREWTFTVEERKRIDDLTTLTDDTDLIDMINWWGSVPGSVLLDYGMDESKIDDPEKEYQIAAWMIGSHIIKAIINPDELGDRPFSVTSFVVNPDSIYGKSVYDLIKPICQMANQVARHLVLNVGIASGPQVAVKSDYVDGADDYIFPFKVWRVTSGQMAEHGKPVEFWQPEMVSEKLLKVYEFCEEAADNQSGVPRYATGNQERTGGPANTASGFSMLMTQAARGIKGVVSNIDVGIIEPSVRKQAQHNLKYEQDIDIIGDIKFVAKGSSSLIAKEQQAMRRNEFLASTNNPVDVQLLGPEIRLKALKEALKALEIDLDGALDDDRMAERIQMIQAEQMQQRQMELVGQPPPPGQQGQIGTPPAPKQLGPGGQQPTGGQDFNAFSATPMKNQNPMTGTPAMAR
jgi:hypothetical protein